MFKVRAWRKVHPMTVEQRRKDACRSYANVYRKRGKLEPEPCEVCGDFAQMHHDDYSKPLLVRWFCRPHHLTLHRLTRETPPGRRFHEWSRKKQLPSATLRRSV
jgi:hypothetical protein